MVFQMIQTWYRWQTNIACLARSGGLKGALDLSETLSGGDEVMGRAPQEIEVYSQIFYNECVKGEVDAAIKAEGISTCGKKLARWKDLTRTKYATEDDSIRAEVHEKHQEALMNWKEKHELARAGVIQDLRQEEKIRYVLIHIGNLFSPTNAEPSMNLGCISIISSTTCPTRQVDSSSAVLLEDRTQPQVTL